MIGKKSVCRVFSRCTGAALALLVSACTESSPHANPYAEFLSRSAAELPPLEVPSLLKTVSGRLKIARDLRHRTWAALDPRSTLDAASRTQLLEQAVAQIDGLARQAQDGTSGKAGDPNMARFLLAPLLYSVLDLREAGAVPPEKISGWLEVFRPGVDFQYEQYGGNTDKNWDTRLAGGYPNMDAAYVLVMGLASKLYDEPRYAEDAETFVGYIRENVQSGGSVRYVGNNRAQGLRVNAAPVYTGVVINFIGSYYTLTGSPAARELLASMAAHYPRAWIAPGIPENSTAPWWKHTNYRDRLEGAGVFEIIAAAARSPQNKYYADQLAAMGRMKVQGALAAVDFYDPYVEAQAPADRVIVPDPDIDGFRGRFGRFSWVGSLGPTQDTLVGALAVEPQFEQGTASNAPPAGYDCHSLLLVSPEVGLAGHAQPRQPLYEHAAFATGQDYPGSSMIAADGGFAVLAAQYRLRQPGIYKPENPETGWTVEQVWLFMEDTLIGRTVMRYDGIPPETSYARLRIRTEPRGALVPGKTPGEYAVGPLRLNILEAGFPRRRHGPAETLDHRKDAPNADEIFLEEGGQRAARHDTSVCLRYGGAPQANAFITLSAPGLTGFSVSIASRRYAVWFNQTDQAVPLPADSGGRVWASDERAKTVMPQSSSDAPDFVPPYGVACRVVE